MNQYECFFTRFVGEVAEFVVFNAEDDARAWLRAENYFADHPAYASSEIFEAGRRVGARERPATKAAPERIGLSS